jgi:hypothetical protein
MLLPHVDQQGLALTMSDVEKNCAIKSAPMMRAASSPIAPLAKRPDRDNR